MCGIAGLRARDAEQHACAMARALEHRGPDDFGVWTDSEAGLALSHARLSVLDLSSAGHQPMISASGRYVISFNGEIYNHGQLRLQMESEVPNRNVDDRHCTWKGNSDTETILACFAAWGVDRTLDAMIGMFAFALWDREQRVLHLGRDRMGEKPLYYGWVGNSFAFASELKAFHVLPHFSNRVDRMSLALYLTNNVVPTPRSIYDGIAKLPAGSLLSIGADDLDRRVLPQPRPYWDLLDVAHSGIRHQLQFKSESEAVDSLEEVLKSAVSGQMIADVPIGAFLSGGIDSSTIVALMQAQSMKPVRTFSIGFVENEFNEAGYARAVAEYLRTDHTELLVTPRDAQAVIPRLSEIYCEPFADSSQIPTLLVAQLARRRVTVSLSGDGGDELFGGYNRHFLAARLWGGITLIPKTVRGMLANLIKSVPPSSWETVFHILQFVLPSRFRLRNPSEKLSKVADVLGLTYGTELYTRLTTNWNSDEIALVPGVTGQEPNGRAQKLQGLTEYMMAMDAIGYLPDRILAKVDRAAMSVGLETRIPYLDHRVVEFAWRLSPQRKIRDGQGKWLLRQVLKKHVPQRLTERPKMGFAVPIDSWLRGPLRAWAEDLLGEGLLKRQGYLDPKQVRRIWAEHLSGRKNSQHQLWNILMLQTWLARWCS